MKTATTLCLVALSWLVPASAGADVFLYSAAFSTSGTWECWSSIPCTGEGTSTLTIGTGSQVATLTFTGVTTTVDVTNHAVPLSLGRFEVAAPAGVVFPVRWNNPTGLPIVRFYLGLAESSPVVETTLWYWAFGPGGRVDLPMMVGSSYRTWPHGPAAPYGGAISTLDPYPLLLKSGTTELMVNVGAAPEPGSMLLLATGLAAAAVRHRARRRSRANA